MDTKSSSFSKTWISISQSTFWLRLKTASEWNETWRCPSSLTVAFLDKPLDLTMELPISCCVLGSKFCKLIKTEKSSSSKQLTESLWFPISSRDTYLFLCLSINMCICYSMVASKMCPIFSEFLVFWQLISGSWKMAKYEKPGKHWSYCTR